MKTRKRPPIAPRRFAPSTSSHPYPAPVASLEQRLDRYRDPQRRRAQSLLLWPLEKPRPDRSILVAGCGTSQAARHALMEPDARVTAIDVSETSLRHTRDLQQKHDIRNLQLHRLAIERIGELGETFDQIVCTGVLHHLSDPDAGLRALRDVLARDGAMHIMVYAPYGRAGITMMQDYCRLLGIGVGDEDLRDLGQTVQALPVDHPIAGVVKRAKDFAQPNALADALLNPQDRAYSVPQIYDWLERCGLKFGRWYEQAAYLPQCGAIDGRAAWRSPCSASPARATCGGGASARNDGPAQLRRLPRRSRTRSPADHVRRRRLARVSFQFGFPGR